MVLRAWFQNLSHQFHRSPLVSRRPYHQVPTDLYPLSHRVPPERLTSWPVWMTHRARLSWTPTKHRCVHAWKLFWETGLHPRGLLWAYAGSRFRGSCLVSMFQTFLSIQPLFNNAREGSGWINIPYFKTNSHCNATSNDGRPVDETTPPSPTSPER